LRAEEVKRRLVSDCGIEATRLQAMGLGERFLYDEADPKAAENRRVEFQAMS
jgi:OOP family OmpA-OmpF porin